MDLPRDDRGVMATKIEAISVSLKSNLRPPNPYASSAVAGCDDNRCEKTTEDVFPL